MELSPTQQSNRQMRRPSKSVRIAGGGYTSQKQATRYLADGRGALNAHGELEFLASDPKHQAVLARLNQPSEVDQNSHYQWQRRNSGGMRIWTGRFHGKQSQ